MAFKERVQGFFVIFLLKKMKVLITNNHLINKEFLKNEKELIYIIEIEDKKIKRKIDLEYERY